MTVHLGVLQQHYYVSYTYWVPKWKKKYISLFYNLKSFVV